MKECGAATAGFLRCVEPSLPEHECLLFCLTEADCDQIRELVCDGGFNGLHAPNKVANRDLSALSSPSPSPWGEALEACYVACAPPPAGTCAMGDGSMIAKSTLIRCDGQLHCDDGSDETDCVSPSTFTCPPEEDPRERTLPTSLRCDGRQDCLGGGDEADCPSHRCDDGGTIRRNQRCDGTPDCLDQSDEAGCSQIFCN